MKTPTEQQLKDPAWWRENAPDWASSIGFIESAGSFVWFNLEQYQYLDGSQAHLIFPFDGGGGFQLGNIRSVAPRPAVQESKQWDGSGPLPGFRELAEVSYTPQLGRWWPNAQLIALHDGMAVFIREGKRKPLVRELSDVQFRPNRTQAERERDELARDLLDDLSTLNINVSGKTATALAINFMNRGWRKGKGQ